MCDIKPLISYMNDVYRLVRRTTTKGTYAVYIIGRAYGGRVYKK